MMIIPISNSILLLVAAAWGLVYTCVTFPFGLRVGMWDKGFRVSGFGFGFGRRGCRPK